MKTTVGCRWLIEVLTKNRAGHKDEFERAFRKYREHAVAEMERNLADAKAGKPLRLTIGLTRPVNMTSAYDRVIGMLEQARDFAGSQVDAPIELSESDWKQYVQDVWDWTYQFKNSTSAYTGEAPPEDE